MDQDDCIHENQVSDDLEPPSGQGTRTSRSMFRTEANKNQNQNSNTEKQGIARYFTVGSPKQEGNRNQRRSVPSGAKETKPNE